MKRESSAKATSSLQKISQQKLLAKRLAKLKVDRNKNDQSKTREVKLTLNNIVHILKARRFTQARA